MTIDHLPGRTIFLDGSEHLFFSGTSYLGMGHQPVFRANLLEGMSQYGTVFSASRNNNLQLAIYENAENYLAEWTGAEAALTVTSGLLAGQIVMQHLDNQRFIYAPSVHPAIWQNSTPQYFFKNGLDFSENIIEKIASQESPVVVCVNTIDPLRCKDFDFDWLNNLPENQSITLVFDDSHGLGVTGTEGGGFWTKLRKNFPTVIEKENVKIIVIASLAKALGIPGGVILSDKKTIETMRKSPFFVGASPIIPAYLHAFLASKNVYSEARKVLAQNIELFKNEMTDSNLFKTFDSYPVFFTEKNDLCNFLIKHKVFISNFSYPNPSDPPITRVIISAIHTEGDIRFLIEQIRAFNKLNPSDRK